MAWGLFGLLEKTRFLYGYEGARSIQTHIASMVAAPTVTVDPMFESR